MSRMVKSCLAICLGLGPLAAWGSSSAAAAEYMPGVTLHPIAVTCLALFVLAYALVIMEERLHLRKSKPVILAAMVIWVLIGILSVRMGLEPSELRSAALGDLDEWAEMGLFLLSAMTFINVMQERDIFNALQSKLVRAGLNLRQLFWATGAVAFFLSPVADNLTTALVLGAVILSVKADDERFVPIACINVVVAANAGGAFSPFGDITTLMGWQAGHVPFQGFLALFLPSLVNWVVPAFIMSLSVPRMRPEQGAVDIKVRRGGFVVCGLFLATITTAVCMEQFLDLPPFMGMMLGLSALMFYTWFLKHNHDDNGSDIFAHIARAEWDTLLFFFGVIMAVGGLTHLGYLHLMGTALYGQLGATTSNVLLGMLSSIIDNIPIMYAVISMQPQLDTSQWLLITLTAGVGGSMLSIGSAAGVGLMGVARGKYTFFRHLVWLPVIATGYAASIAVHLLIN